MIGSQSRNLLTDVTGAAVGNAEDLWLGSGVTVMVFDRPAIASVSILGGAPGGRDTELLAPHNTVETVDAIVLSGGSAFGLDAAGGVQAALREQGRGYAVRDVRVPIVPQAILFDLTNGGKKTGAGSHRIASWATPRRPRSAGISLSAASARAPAPRPQR